MDRLDKVIANQTKFTRSEVKNLIKSKRVKVNNIIVNKSDIKIDVDNDVITIDENEIKVKNNIYIVLNKPKGYISATEDKSMPTILDIVEKDYSGRNLFPVGRLDKDTTGLIILTNDGNFAHNILSPKKDSKKIYKAILDIKVTSEMIEGFKNGVELIDGKCKPANLEKIDEYTALVTLTEGKYHQVKRMFGCYKAKVVELCRIQIGNFKLPKDLKEGKYRELTEEELELILNN